MTVAMKELFVLRHAKSSRDDPSLDDHDRPLAKRGERDARAMGEHMRAKGFAPKLVLCSSSRRTRDTLALIAPCLSASPEVHFERRLYLASTRALLKRLHEVEDHAPSVMLVGHNPGLEELILLLARESAEGGERKTRVEIEEKFPTGALAVLRFPASRWSALAPGTGRLAALVRPKDLDARDP
jgi:phosphohistidine phosphatase